jgi:DNA-3-methyladenine glycosylase
MTGLGRRLARSSLAGDAVQLAPTLLGRVIVSDTPDGRVAVRLTEVEAYRGVDDPASHASRGLTRRNSIMFDEPGHLYTYFVYGMHWCANVVTGPRGQPSAVLLRAGEVVLGHELAASRRSDRTKPQHLARGPAGLASVLGFAAAQNGADLCRPGAPISIRAGAGRPLNLVQAGPRVGVNVGVEQQWRFWEIGAASVSVFRPGVKRRPPSDSR